MTAPSTMFEDLNRALSEGETKIDFVQDYLAKVVDVDEMNRELRDHSQEMGAISELGSQVVGSEHWH